MALLLSGAGLYSWKTSAPPPVLIKTEPPPVTPPPPASTSEVTTLPPPQRQQEQEKPPFTIALPTPFTETDLIQFLASAYAIGRNSDIAVARSMLSSPAARATAQWLLLRSGPPLSFQWYTAFRKSTPDWPAPASLNRRIEVALLTSQIPDADKTHFFEENPPMTSAGRIFMGKQLLSRGQKQEALDLIRPVWVQERLQESTEKQIRADYAALLTTQDHRTRMIFLMNNKNWDAALRAAKDAGDGAEALVDTRMAVVTASKKAQAEIDALPKTVKDDSLAVYSRFLMLVRQKKAKEMVDLLGQLASTEGAMPLTAPECHDWQLQQRSLARTLIDSREFENAYRAASASLSKRGCVYNDADFLAGWIALRFLDRATEAQKHFETLTANAKTASQKARALYWSGRAAERLGDRRKAREFYGQAARFWNSFYGQLSADNLGTPLTVPEAEVKLAPDIRERLEKATAWQALRLLEAGGASDVAIRLYAEMASILPDESQLSALASLAEEMKNARAMVIVARIAGQRGFDLKASGYPVFGLPELTDKNTPNDKALAYTIAHQESAFNIKAKSSAGALGLMQLMPATARTTADRYKIPFDLERLSADPAYNVQLGMAHFTDLQTAWKGSLILSFAAYNAGSGNVKKWIGTYGDPRSTDIDMIDWIERIPFPETRHYVQRLTENLSIYRRLMGVSLPSPVASGILPSTATR